MRRAWEHARQRGLYYELGKSPSSSTASTSRSRHRIQDELPPRADFVILTVPHTPATEGFFERSI